jgi:hypothetical protein
MYRGHILAEWENIFDIADIDGNRRGVRTFFPPYMCAKTKAELNRIVSRVLVHELSHSLKDEISGDCNKDVD